MFDDRLLLPPAIRTHPGGILPGRRALPPRVSVPRRSEVYPEQWSATIPVSSHQWISARSLRARALRAGNTSHCRTSSGSVAKLTPSSSHTVWMWNSVIAQTVHLNPFRRKSEPPERFAAGFSGVGLNAKEEITGRVRNPAEFCSPNRAEVVAVK